MMAVAAVPERRESYISTQLCSIDSRLQSLFDDLGISQREREQRERNVYAVISEALEGHVKSVTEERESLRERCCELQSGIKDMLSALKDLKPNLILKNPTVVLGDVHPPYIPLCEQLQGAFDQVESIYSDRLYRVNQTFETLKELASKVDGIEVANELMLSDEDLDLSNERIVQLESEVGRWQEELSSRISTVAEHAAATVSLWAELGTPQSEIDSRILSCYRSNPEELGTLQSDVARLAAIRSSLEAEKYNRQERLDALRQQITHLQSKFSESSDELRAFDRANRGLAMPVLEAFERELFRLEEKKRQHIHIFIQDARESLKQLWQQLYYSEDEMLDFTPAWTEIYTDASLDAHESEIARLQSLLQERKPIISLIDEYYGLQRDAEALEASAQDSSRLLSKGPGRRDPTRLLREEQMRKRISKKRPKVLNELRAAVNSYMQNHQKPFLVNGNDFSIELNEMLEKQAPSSRGRTNTKSTKVNTNPSARSASPMKTSKSQSRSPTKKANHARVRPVSPAKSTSALSHISSLTYKSIPAPVFKKPIQPASGATRIPSAPPAASKAQTELKRTFSQPQAKPKNQAPKFNILDTNKLHGTAMSAIKPIVTTNGGAGKENIRAFGAPPSLTGSTTTSPSENWESYDDSSSEDELVNENYMKWKEEATKKLLNGDGASTTTTAASQPRVSEFDWDKDTF